MEEGKYGDRQMSRKKEGVEEAGIKERSMPGRDESTQVGRLAGRKILREERSRDTHEGEREDGGEGSYERNGGKQHARGRKSRC